VSHESVNQSSYLSINTQTHNKLSCLSLQLRSYVAIASFYSTIDYYVSLPHPAPVCSQELTNRDLQYDEELDRSVGKSSYGTIEWNQLSKQVSSNHGNLQYNGGIAFWIVLVYNSVRIQLVFNY
jgi:hypothetical protein